jgi:hypothetical protein
MTARLKAAFRSNGCREHVQEFGGCAGIVVGEVDYGNGVVGPELDVRWIPSYLVYAYEAHYLTPSRKKIRGWRKKQELARRIAALKAV